MSCTRGARWTWSAGNGLKSDALRAWPSLGAQPNDAGKAKSSEILASPSSVDCTGLETAVHYMRMGVPLYDALYHVFQACVAPAVNTRSSSGDAKLDGGATQHADISVPQQQHHHDNDAKEPPAWRQVCIPI